MVRGGRGAERGRGPRGSAGPLAVSWRPRDSSGANSALPAGGGPPLRPVPLAGRQARKAGGPSPAPRRLRPRRAGSPARREGTCCASTAPSASVPSSERRTSAIPPRRARARSPGAFRPALRGGPWAAAALRGVDRGSPGPGGHWPCRATPGRLGLSRSREGAAVLRLALSLSPQRMSLEEPRSASSPTPVGRLIPL